MSVEEQLAWRSRKINDSPTQVLDFFGRGSLRHELVQNVLSLYGVQVANYLTPLLALPYLARVLGASGWGLVAFGQAFGAYVTLAGEYAFAYSATREVARQRNDQERLAGILAGVLGAKGLLIPVATALAFLGRRWTPLLHAHPLLFWWVMFWAVCQAANMEWYFRGLERMRLLATIQITTRLFALISIFIFVRGPGDEWRVFAVQGLGQLISFAICMLLAYRELPIRWPTSASIREALRMGKNFFLFEASVSLYTVANTFVLGLFVPAELVGFYAGADKIVRSGLRMLDPISQTLYPRVSHLVFHAPERAAKLAKIGAVFTIAGGVAMGGCVLVLAPEIVRVLLGAGYMPAVPILRILALLPLFASVSTALGKQWALPLGLERSVNVVCLVAGLLNLSLAAWLAHTFAGLGIACVVVFTEVLIASGIYLVLRLHKLAPARSRIPAEETPKLVNEAAGRNQ